MFCSPFSSLHLIVRGSLSPVCCVVLRRYTAARSGNQYVPNLRRILQYIRVTYRTLLLPSEKRHCFAAARLSRLLHHNLPLSLFLSLSLSSPPQNMATAAQPQQQQYASAVDATPGPLYVDTQHEDLVHDAQMDYYGSKLATCSSGALMTLWHGAGLDFGLRC